MKILAIETSADETSLALVETTEADGSVSFNVLGFSIASQIELHNQYGGIFPAMAKREHQKNLPILLEQILSSDSSLLPSLDYICVTTGPGLEPTLWTGIVFAKELSEKYNVPIIPVNHMEGHILSVLAPDLAQSKMFEVKKDLIPFPALALLISGGHTELVLVNRIGDYTIIGKTRDDAVGEAFDKVARMMDLPYPGGPQISKLAAQARTANPHPDPLPKGEGATPIFPRPMIHSKDYDFSFSGLKTAVLYYIRSLTTTPPPSAPSNSADATSPYKGEDSVLTNEAKQDIAREFENAVTETLVSKTKKALEEFGANALIVGGGVSANTFIISELQRMLTDDFPEVKLLAPTKELTGDNALMIALAGYFKLKKAGYIPPDPSEIKAEGNLSL